MASQITQLGAAELNSVLQRRHFLIVGGTAGLGKALAVSALKRGAQVTIVGRRSPGADLAGAKFIQKDLSLVRNAVELAKEVDIESADTIFLTTGIFAGRTRAETIEGIELDMAVSYLSRYAFMREVLGQKFGSKRADQSVKPRVFVMGFPGVKNVATIDDFNSEAQYGVMSAHMNTVVGNEALVAELNSKFNGAANVYGLNPGIIKTEIREGLLGKGWVSWMIESVIGWFTPTPEEYAEGTLIHLAVSEELENRSGLLIDQKRKVLAPNSWLVEGDHQARVIQESQRLTDRALAATL